METTEKIEKQLEGATLQTNEFILKMTGMLHLKFKVTDYCVTKGQPWGGVTTEELGGNGGVIVVKSGRQGSKEVASWFESKIKPGSAIGCDSIDKLPEKLNFAFIGTMTFEHSKSSYTGEEIVIGQGHNGHNNWWIGGPKMTEVLDLKKFAKVATQDFLKTSQGGKSTTAKVAFAISFGDINTMGVGIVDL